MDAKLPMDTFENVMQLAIEGCKAVAQYIREVISTFLFYVCCIFLKKQIFTSCKTFYGIKLRLQMRDHNILYTNRMCLLLTYQSSNMKAP